MLSLIALSFATMALFATSAFAGATTKRSPHANLPTVLLGIRPNADGNCTGSIYTDAAFCEANTLQRESNIGRKFAILSEYGQFDFTSIPFLEWAVSTGHMPMYTWQHELANRNCIFWQDVVNGAYDAQLTSQANYLATLGQMIVRLLPEMNKPHQACLYDVDSSVDPVTAGNEFKALWQHVYKVVHPIAPNVQFDFSPGNDAYSSSDQLSTVWLDYYPGDDYVDWIGTQDYNMSCTIAASVQTDFRTNAFYSQAVVRGKPLILSETGACENSSVHRDPQQHWFYSMSANFADAFPAIKALVIYDAKGIITDYRLSGNGPIAVANMGAKKYFQAGMPQ